MLCKAVTRSASSLTNVEESTSGAPDTVDDMGGDAGKSLSYLEGLFGSLDGGDGGGILAGVAPTSGAAESARGGMAGERGADQGVVERAIPAEG